MTTEFKLGLIINPLAGIGGPAGLKGSDGESTVAEALGLGVEPQSQKRALRTLELLTRSLPESVTLQLATCTGDMGEKVAAAAGLMPSHLFDICHENTTAVDTKLAAHALKKAGVDLLIFVGGDGTARDIFDAVGSQFPVLGIPAGVKMHSGCYAISPEAAAKLIEAMARGESVAVQAQEVRDIDEEGLRKGQVKARYYGELLVPEKSQYLQAVKNSGREVEELSLADIAANVVETMDADTLYIIGPGTTTRSVMEELQLENTLLGVDVVLDHALVASDVSAPELEKLVANHNGPAKAVITVIGGQGHIIGRGNQQLSPVVLKQLGRENIIVLATRSKLAELEGRPLLVDSNDPKLDQELSGFIQVIVGYHDTLMVRVGYESND